MKRWRILFFGGLFAYFWMIGTVGLPTVRIFYDAAAIRVAELSQLLQKLHPDRVGSEGIGPYRKESDCGIVSPRALAVFHVDDQFELGRLLDGQIGRAGALQRAVVSARATLHHIDYSASKA